MSKFIHELDIDFDTFALDSIRNSVLEFHSSHREEVLSVYNPGNMTNPPALGYYVTLFEDTFEEKQKSIESWKDISNDTSDRLKFSTINMSIGKGLHQNLYVVKPKIKFSELFYTNLDKVLSQMNIEYDKLSPSICVQEYGYSMKFHTDSGVSSRAHINLNRDSIDMFYTAERTYRAPFGKCFIIEASKTNHGFMSFQSEPRVHLMLDIL